MVSERERREGIESGERGSLWAVVLAGYDRLAPLRAFAGGEHEWWAVRQAYALAPTVGFTRSILEACPQMLAVSKLPGLTWCDLGSPERVVKMLTRLGVSAPWLTTYPA